ncbi:SEC-C domain-containing protein [Dactylosporangium vinaceum]|uniref:SEC-C domain-containing protein n=1 Tax=Dactylosporangium vinaceum TaxID=53362 RepID=A0ABV5MPQ6_9ACTN|nr:SEC-C domain-containing protein [Dactylosporangium vinaceum]UAB96695.1 SEC-C domain-containing protein [Dactylosporangium vinaceum]
MLTKGELTGAELREIRQSALGTADPLGVAAGLAEAVDAGRLADRDDAGFALLVAAEIAESRSKLDAALKYVERAVEAYAGRDDGEAGAARALRARILFRGGREDEAIAELEALRPLLGSQADAPAYISAALAAGGRHQVAEEWLTEAVRVALAERSADGEKAAEPRNPEDAGVLFFLLQQRHRVRHIIGRQHDAHDNLAERLESRLAVAGAAAGAEAADDLLFWPQAEFARLVEQWPELTEAYGATWDEHRARLERAMVRAPGGTLLEGKVDGLAAFAAKNDGTPADAKTRAGYADRLAAGAGHIAWPPERNGACWCGSGNKYKKCCLPRSRG